MEETVSGKFRRWYLVLGVTAAALAGASPALAGVVVDPGPIRPEQSFVGLVNGVSDRARIVVNCGGPITPGKTGHPVAGQTVAVQQVIGAPVQKPGEGFTGTAGKEIGVALATSVPPLRLRFYGTSAQIPTDVPVPCSGESVVVFAPEPTSPTARAATVKVLFASLP
jgi:hypothetical protein